MNDRRPDAATMDRRMFLAAATTTAAAPALAAEPPPIPIIDTHIHLFDPNRPQGAPYRGPRGSTSNTLGALPDRYAQLARPLGVVGAICVEASPWVEDNLWVLQVMEKAPIMVGFTGNLNLMAPEFSEYLGRYAKNPLFRGVRYGNIFGYDLAKNHATPAGSAGLKALADAGLLLEVANPRIDLLQAVVRVNDAHPNLQIIVDHLPNFVPAAEGQAAYEAVLKELAVRPKIAVKLSEILRRENDVVATGLAPYKARLDHIYETFGEDRVLFGSDWPNSDGVARIEDVFAVARAYFATKSRAQAEKYFWRNSVGIYRWTRRAPDQPTIS
jgi:predicted TIM-barrel fold metal-dependent hydrolase